MKSRAIALSAIGLLVVIGWNVFHVRHPNPTVGAAGQQSTQQPAATEETLEAPSSPIHHSKSLAPSGAATEQRASYSSNSLTAVAASAPPAVEPTFESTNLPPATILENMRTVIRQYGTMFGGNPVGTNPEITKALQGDNPKHINFLKADGNRLNTNGELVDPWGTPYFFHQLSGTEMEIRSAGPDRVMYTTDDLVIK